MVHAVYLFVCFYSYVFSLLFLADLSTFWDLALADVFCFFVSFTSCQAHWHFPEVERDFLLVREVIRVARLLRAQCGMTKEKPVSKSTVKNSPFKQGPLLMNAQRLLDRNPVMYIDAEN